MRGTFGRTGPALLTIAALVLPAAAEASEVPRMPSGKPDLSGTYDVATLTPLQRPAHFGERLALTAQEAEAIATHWRTNLGKDYEPSDPDREAPPEGGVGIFAPEFTGAAGKVGGYNAFYVDIGEASFQVDGKYRTSILIDPPDGRYPELSAEGKRRAAETAPLRHENTGTAWWMDLEVGPYDDPELRPLAERCLLSRSRSGPPALPAMYNNLKRIVQTEDTVMIMAEQMHDARIIRLDAEHEPPELRRWMGDSIGWWEGDTLVVETINFREVPRTVARASRDVVVTERFTRTGRDELIYEFTVEDPSYTQPYTGEYVWPTTEHKVYEYACHEGNYSFGGILRGARVLEADARKAGVSGSDD